MGAAGAATIVTDRELEESLSPWLLKARTAKVYVAPTIRSETV